MWTSIPLWCTGITEQVPRLCDLRQKPLEVTAALLRHIGFNGLTVQNHWFGPLSAALEQMFLISCHHLHFLLELLLLRSEFRWIYLYKMRFVDTSTSAKQRCFQVLNSSLSRGFLDIPCVDDETVDILQSCVEAGQDGDVSPGYLCRRVSSFWVLLKPWPGRFDRSLLWPMLLHAYS